MQKRLDQWLVELAWAPTRSKAKELILAGSVYKNQEPLLKPGELFSHVELGELRREDSDILKYVSRGGLKLKGALTHLYITIEGKRALDIGSSTGGFSHCLLQQGAQQVIGFDVGHDQLHASLANHPKLTNFEGVHFADASQHTELQKCLQDKFDIIVADISFVSVTKLLPLLKNWVLPGGRILILIKPQFELAPESLNKKGVVKNGHLYKEVQDKICNVAIQNGFKVLDYFPSCLKGKDGNQEFFLYGG